MFCCRLTIGQTETTRLFFRNTSRVWASPVYWLFVFTKGGDTIHHWNTFANGPAGCRIIFKAEPLLNAVNKAKGVRSGIVEYIKINELKRYSKVTNTWPFIKRWPYSCEDEFRIIYESNNPRDCNKMELKFSIKLEWIDSIMINQSVPKNVFESIKEFHSIKSKCSCRAFLYSRTPNLAWEI